MIQLAIALILSSLFLTLLKFYNYLILSRIHGRVFVPTINKFIPLFMLYFLLVSALAWVLFRLNNLLIL